VLCLGTLASGAETTRVLQQGLGGYAGVADTWVSRLDWDTPPQYTVSYGQNQEINLSRDGGDNPLLRFDLASVPPNSTIVSATLSLHNTTQSSWSGDPRPRRVELYRVLVAWDEGNQVGSPIDAAGKHGATGDKAFSYFPGEGTSVPWSARGMAEGTDFASWPEGFTDVVDAGWYEWDATALVRSWVRGEQPSLGLVLRDATGYEDDNRDWRTFISSQGGEVLLRPKLTVVYDPDTPWANAGPDQSTFAWSGGSILLDGSASHDRPGGNDATLAYSWRVAAAAYSSALVGTIAGIGRQLSFTPDVAGEWDFELAVTNDVGASAKDTVHVRLLAIPAGHPRIYLTPAKLAALQARAVPANPRWTQLLGEADSSEGEMHARALVSLVTGQGSYCDEAIVAALAVASGPQYSSAAGDVALVYDWCHHRLSSGQRSTLITYFNTFGDAKPHANDTSGWGNYWPRWGYSYALAGLASFGDNPRAQEWLDEYRFTRFRDIDLALLDRIAEGGAWPEGMIYDWIANQPRVKALEAWRTGTGENLFESTAWFANRLPYILLHRWPGLAEQWGHSFHPYVSTGDTERNRGSMANYERIMSLILLERFPAAPLAPQLQAYLSVPPTDTSQSFLFHEEFLWFDPDRPVETPSLLTHVAAGTGTVFMRSGWPFGAADTDGSPTYLTFQAGDHFTYHQHYDQNSFTLYKRADLLLDSGVYSGDGLSNHDVNYYVRTVAHNTLVVYNPAEDLSAARPDAVSNDGGQRTMVPASRSPQTIGYFDQHAVHYDTADLLRVDDAAGYTYALGDAAKAYNTPAYNQAMDTSLTGNVAKVSRFQRELLYLRPPPGGGADFLVLLDRVGVTQPSFSGANTKLLFHTLGEPAVNGSHQDVSPGETLYSGADLATATSGPAKIFIKSLLPAGRNIRKVGGRGVKAFWVSDGNYDWHWDAGEPQPRPTNDFEDVPYGEWRLEVEPGNDALEHTFLHILYPAESTTPSMPATVVVTGSGLVGAHVADTGRNRLALFSSAADGSAPGGVLTYSFTPTSTTQHVIADLAPGARYSLAVSAAGAVQTVTLTPNASGAYLVTAGGVLSFEHAGTGSLANGDVNGDGAVDVADVFYLINHLFAGGPLPIGPADVNASGTVDVSDVFHLINFLFAGGPPPA